MAAIKIRNPSKILLTITILVLGLSSCMPGSIVLPPTPTPTPFPMPGHNQSLGQLTAVLDAAGQPAQALLYMCLLDYYQQGISLDVAAELCSPKVTDTFDKGFGGTFEGPIAIGGGNIFDPGTITASCS